MAFGQSRRRWFGACSCKPTPRGRPSSVEQLRTSSAFRPFAVLVAHYNRVIGRVNITLKPSASSSCNLQQSAAQLIRPNKELFTCRSVQPLKKRLDEMGNRMRGNPERIEQLGEFKSSEKEQAVESARLFFHPAQGGPRKMNTKASDF